MRSQLERSILDDIERAYGQLLTTADATRALGYSSATSAKKFFRDEGIAPLVLNGRKRWRASDIARRLARMEVMTDDPRE